MGLIGKPEPPGDGYVGTRLRDLLQPVRIYSLILNQRLRGGSPIDAAAVLDPIVSDRWLAIVNLVGF